MAGTRDPVDDRDPASHIRDDGYAKTSYNSELEAAWVANELWARSGKPHNHYLCRQRPDHWHVGKGTPDVRIR